MSRQPSTQPQYKKIISIALSLLAVTTAVGSWTGVERKLFNPDNDQSTLLNSTRQEIEKSTKTKNNLAKKIMSADLNGTYLLTETASKNTTEVAQDFLLFTGVITLSDNSKRALTSGSYVAEGASVRGCMIRSISDTHVEVVINNKPVSIPLYEKYYFQPTNVAQLALDRITKRNGTWVAVFNGKAYRVGDWVDSKTIIQIITPTQVQVKRNGEQILINPSN